MRQPLNATKCPVLVVVFSSNPNKSALSSFISVGDTCTITQCSPLCHHAFVFRQRKKSVEVSTCTVQVCVRNHTFKHCQRVGLCLCWTARLPKTHAFKHTYEEGERIDTYSFRYDVEVHNNKPLGKSNKIEANVIWIQVHNNKTLGERNYIRTRKVGELTRTVSGTTSNYATINPLGGATK